MGIIRDVAAAFLLGFALPSVLLGAAVCLHEPQPQAQYKAAETVPAQPREEQIRYPVLIRTGDSTEIRDLDSYLVGVVLAEMPASFELEALKAQAVAARTYAVRAEQTGGKHTDGSVCTESNCCQSYISPENYLTGGGSEEDLQKVRTAVEATSGLILTYQGAAAEATYFSCSGGRTEDAVAVWGTDYPYLQSVESPGEEEAAYYRDTVSFAPEEFAGKLGIAAQGPPETWFTLTEYTRGGSVSTIVIGGQQFTGTQLRSALGLRSAAFSVEVVQGQIRIVTQGYGHRVGMSQYGAEAMAVQGSSFADILSHYYPGTELTPMSEPEQALLTNEENYGT